MRHDPITIMRRTSGPAWWRSLAAILVAVATLATWAPAANAARPAVLAFTPAPFTFGTIAKGATVTQTFTLTNTGGSGTSKLTLSLTGSPAFTIPAPVPDDDRRSSGTDDRAGRTPGNTCSGRSLEPGRSCTVVVTYHPTTDGAADRATLTATANKRAVTASVNLSGSTPAVVVETVSITGPGDQTPTTRTPVSLQIAATDSIGAPLTYSASGLPPGLSINPATGLISGSITTEGTYPVTVTCQSGGHSAKATKQMTITG